MTLPVPSPPLLQETLRLVARRYRLPPAPPIPQGPASAPATALAGVIEQARAWMAQGRTPEAAMKHRFVEALVRLIHEAMRAEDGDPAFQAMVLRHRSATVRAHASLSAHADKDRRQVRAAVNAIAHPARLRRSAPGPRRQALARLHASAARADWPALSGIVQSLLGSPQAAGDPPLAHSLAQLAQSEALQRLLRLDALAADAAVQQYQSLWQRQGPISGSPAAAVQGSASRERGARVEALTASALEALARRLDAAERDAPLAPGSGGRAVTDPEHPHHTPDPDRPLRGADEPRVPPGSSQARYRVVTSLRVPSPLAAHADRAKSEWDAVLLRRAQAPDGQPAWDVCLLAEAKASVDAAATDLPRLLRGLQLFAHAEAHIDYVFRADQGPVRLRGASLRALAAPGADPAGFVLYCCDAPADAHPRLLSAASRMQLLSAHAALAYAADLAEGRQPDAHGLDPVWEETLASPRWGAVLHQYRSLHQARKMMVHIEDLAAAIDLAARDGEASG